MKEVEVQVGMSLLDVSLIYYGTLECVMDIAEENSLPLDYTFSESRKIRIPDYRVRRVEDMNTGIEGESGWTWLLEEGRIDVRGLWVDYDWWKDNK